MTEHCNCTDEENWGSTLQFVMWKTDEGKDFPTPLYVCEGCNTEVPMIRESHWLDDVEMVLSYLGEYMAKHTPELLVKGVNLLDNGPIQMKEE